MRTRCLIIGAMLAVLAGAGERARAASGDAALAGEVLKVFREKCANCHSPDAKPKPDKFDYILDLHKLKAQAKYISPGDPSKGLLCTQLARNDMPPDDSPIEPLNDAQKEVVNQWVRAGCPTEEPATKPLEKQPRPLQARLISFLGKFHPLAAHTPIAVLMAAAIAEMLYLRTRAPALTVAVRFCCVLGAMGAVVTAALGWAMASTHSSSELMESHRWAGTIAGCASIPIALFGEWGARRAHREGRAWHGFSRWLFRLAVFGIAGYVGFAAHLGGIIHWGTDVFKFPTF